jgi:asparagine N-glycosylation enzyme membrane subunit Stt3
LKKTIGITLLLHPVLIPILLFINQIEFFWYWLAEHQRYDFVYACISLVVFLAGLVLVFKHGRLNKSIVVLTVFIVYQAFSLSADGKRFDARVELPEGRGIALVNHSGGAMASGFSNLVLAEPFYWFFCRESVIKSYPDAGFGQLQLLDDKQLKVDLKTYDKKQISEIVSLDKWL